MKHAIIYSQVNFDSNLATAILRMKLSQDSEEVKSFVYNRGGNSFEAPSDFEVVYVLGANISADDMVSLFEANTVNTIYHVYVYDNSTKYPERITAELVKQNRWNLYTEESTDDFTISVSSRICAELKDDTINYLENKSFNTFELIKEYAGVASLYMNFLPMTALQTSFLFANINNVRRSATGKEVLFLENGNTINEKKQYDEYVQDIRQLVKANMTIAYYAGANGSGLQTPTICVGEKDALLAMRFINYAHDEVISYEDTRSARIYRILSKTNLQWYIKRFEPRDIWSEGRLTYIKTELPQHVR